MRMLNQLACLLLIGLGASPGLTNLMALIAIRELDEVTTVYTGWDAGAATIDETAKQQSTNAAMLHAIEQMTGKVKIYQDSAYQMVKPLQAINVEYPGLPNLTGNIFGHPEAVTFPHYFSELKDCPLILPTVVPSTQLLSKFSQVL